jgi:hypothetical protein
MRIAWGIIGLGVAMQYHIPVGQLSLQGPVCRAQHPSAMLADTDLVVFGLKCMYACELLQAAWIRCQSASQPTVLASAGCTKNLDCLQLSSMEACRSQLIVWAMCGSSADAC